jgi:hypothetical protein
MTSPFLEEMREFRNEMNERKRGKDTLSFALKLRVASESVTTKLRMGYL